MCQKRGNKIETKNAFVRFLLNVKKWISIELLSNFYQEEKQKTQKILLNWKWQNVWNGEKITKNANQNSQKCAFWYKNRCFDIVISSAKRKQKSFRLESFLSLMYGYNLQIEGNIFVEFVLLKFWI